MLVIITHAGRNQKQGATCHHATTQLCNGMHAKRRATCSTQHGMRSTQLYTILLCSMQHSATQRAALSYAMRSSTQLCSIQHAMYSMHAAHAANGVFENLRGCMLHFVLISTRVRGVTVVVVVVVVV